MVILSVFLGLIILTIVTLLLYRAYCQWQIIKRSNQMRSAGGVSAVEEVTLGGLKQYILIQAEDVQKPVLLVIHGGPSLPIPGVTCRGVDWVLAFTTNKLIKHFTLVFWDQRGTGKSYSPNTPASSINVEQFISDANELTDWLRRRFNQNKIFLAGVSWGTIIGVQLAHRYPDKFHAYIAMSQIVNWAESDKIAYDWLIARAKEINNQKAIKELTEIGTPPYIDKVSHWNLLRKWLFMLGGFIYEDGQIRHPGMPYIFKTFLKSPDFKLVDILNTFHKGMKLSYSPQMLDDFAKFDALSHIRKLEVPVYFFHGKHDRAVSAELFERFYHQLEAPMGKQMNWLEQSAHIYSPSDSRQVEKEIIHLFNTRR